jgi:pimeloyl-ACP methyl ester carboxylesterase
MLPLNSTERPDNMTMTTGVQPHFRTLDGLSIRYATSPRPEAPVLLMLSPWPESIYAYQPTWDTLAAQFSLVAVDLPGFGQSEGRPELMSPRAMGDFIAAFAAELGLDQPHGLGPDIGTAALLYAAADHPGVFASIVVGAGAATFPLHTDGLLKTFVEAPNLDPFEALDPGEVIRGSVAQIKHYDIPDLVRDDYVASYAGSRFVDSVAYVRAYPADLEALAPRLAALATPTAIIAGRDDPYALDEDAEILDGQLPHSQLDILETGHCAWEEAPEQYAAVVARWVSGGYRTA